MSNAGNKATRSAYLHASVFGRISRLLVSNDAQLDHIIDAILTESMHALNAHRAFIAMVDYEHGELAVRYTAGAGWSEMSARLRLKMSQETGRGITSHVAATGAPYRTGDVSSDRYYVRHFADARSELAVPILDADGRTQGVINVESVALNAFTEEHEDFLVAVANLIALRIVADEQRKRQAALVSLGREIGRFARSVDLYNRVIDLVAGAIQFEDCSIFLLDKDNTALVLEASRGSLGEKVHEARYSLGEGITGWVAEHGQPARVGDPRKDPRWRGRHEELPPEEVGGLIAAPIQGYDHLLGVLRILRRRSAYAWVPNDFTDEDEGLVVAIASILGAVIDSVNLVKRLVAAERMAAWGEMSARSAHMIGNRVFAIKGDLNELRHVCEECCDREKIMPLITSLERGIFRLEEILSEFREFVVATKLQTSRISINELLQEAVTEAFPRNTPVKLELEFAPDLPPVEADPSKLRRCFSELIENSFNFQQEGGLVRVRTEPVPHQPEQIRVTFEDRGPGIPRDVKKQIFRPFFSTRSKGMGLGLSIVKGIIDAHRGEITETGEEGKGARFEILLPVASA
ncbi:MAG: GAF domain-containing protein [Armatimonadetes bacterium]|nr:GAF domain-containing protein [Armatimonadota bacterium]